MKGPQQGDGFPPPKKDNTRLIIGIGGAVLAAIVALVLILVLTGRNEIVGKPVVTSTQPTPRTGAAALADKLASVIENGDLGDLDNIACTKADAQDVALKVPPKHQVTTTVTGLTETDGVAQATIEYAYDDHTLRLVADLRTRETSAQSWCVQALYAAR
nr:hypothetical protein [Kibdelosporangium sp. MJ126-NF4]CEL16928.1 hypothetical protein [Kibdelosporangium sp. MJ126-NF4]CTQ91843.1 hypothetical protein [Kibdelosporangium sp. MJ126-NF4]